MLVFTSCTNNYIPKARVLASTLKSHHPNWTFCLLLGEIPPASFDLGEEPFDRLMTFDRLEIPEYAAWLFRHRVVEICTAAKGPALHHFLVREEHEKVIYLDPDIMVCNDLSFLETLLDEHDVLLTPHLRAPQVTRQSIVDNELCAMRYGVFNLGFVAAARRGDGIGFANWWRDRLLQYCYDDIPQGLFTDQRWCDLAPAFFPNLHIVRDPGCNAASWNLTERCITRDAEGTFFADNSPLRFYHFTGFDSGAGDIMTARYSSTMPAVHELWALYTKRLMASGHAILAKLRWAHMTFSDGTPITDGMRLLFREREDLQKAFPNPFIRPGFLDWYLAENKIRNALFTRIQRKLGNISRKVCQVLDQHGGMPHGLPGLARQSVDWVRKWGLLGVAKKIWRSAPGVASIHDPLPLLRDMLSLPEGTFFNMLGPATHPVCVIEHDWGGGADAYCQKRVTALLGQGRAVIRLRYSNAAERVEMTVCHGEKRFRCEVGTLYELTDSRLPRIANIIINEFAGWYSWRGDSTGERIKDAVRAIGQVARQHGAQLEFLFHDYFPVCPTTNLLTPQGVYCGLDETQAVCDACAMRNKPFSMTEWRETWGNLLTAADEVVFFSENTRDTVCRVYPLRKEQIAVRPHSVDPLGQPLRIAEDGPMRVAVVGHIQTHKGAGMVIGLASLLEERMPEASIIVFGELDAYPVPRNITVLGPYQRAELAGLLAQHKVTVGFFSSICPETFSYVLHELALQGLPLVSFDLGAQGEYLRTLANSRVASAISAQAVFASLRELDIVRKTAAR